MKLFLKIRVWQQGSTVCKGSNFQFWGPNVDGEGQIVPGGGGDTVLNRRTFNNYYVYQTSLFIAELSTLVSWMKYCLKTWTIMGTVRKTTMKNEKYLPVTGNRLCENSFQKLLTMTARKSKFLYRSIITSLVKASYLKRTQVKNVN